MPASAPITAKQLRAFSPKASQKIIDGIVANQKLLADAGITTPRRIRHFMAQAANETGGLARLEENLNYSAKRLTQVWKKRFPTIAAATPYAKNPEKLANKVYGGRLGNDKAGDGWRYRGSGILQTTGKENFTEVETDTGLPVVSQPQLLRTFPGALQAACIYWKKRGINKLADRDDIEGVTKAVNGGLIGLDDRKEWLAKARKIWPDAAKAAPLLDPPAVALEPESPVVSAETGDVVYTDQENVSFVQQKLKSLGYTEVGGTEGAMGAYTEGAIRAFRADNGLPPAAVIDDALLAALKTAKPREIAQARTDATAAVVTAKVPEARHNWFSKIGAGVLGGGAGTGVILNGVLDKVTDAKSYVNEFTDYVGDTVPGWGWCLIILAAAGFIYWKSQQSENASVAAFQNGERR